MHVALILLVAPVAGLLAFVILRAAEVRSRRSPRLSEEQRLANEIGTYGLPRVVAVETERLRADTGPQRATVTERRFEENLAESRFAKHGKKVLDAHQHLVPYVVLLALPATAAVFLFIANQGLDIGLIETLEISDTQAAIVGSIVVVVTALLAMTVLELLFPGNAIAQIKELARPTRLGWAVAVASLFAGLVIMLSSLATARAETRLGPTVSQARATCNEVRADKNATPGERTLACAEVERRELQLERGRQWDSLVAVAAPVGEGAGLWAVLRLAEVGVAGGLAFRSRRARRLRVAAEANEQHRSDEFVATLVRAGLLAGLSEEEIESLRGLGMADDNQGPQEPSQPEVIPEEPTNEVEVVDHQETDSADLDEYVGVVSEEDPDSERPIVTPHQPTSEPPFVPPPLGGDRWEVV